MHIKSLNMNGGVILANISDRIKKLRLAANMTQEEFGKRFGIVKSTVSLYENGKSTPNDQIKEQICDYFHVSLDYLLGREDAEGHGLTDGRIEERGLDGPGIATILGYPDREEQAISFSHKLALQMDFNGSRLVDVANSIGVTDKIIWAWLIEKREDYANYYKELSEYFNVEPSYWIRPGAVSPGIEPTTQEYYLILKYRFQNQLNEMNDLPIETFFPNCRQLSNLELKYLSSFRQLSEDNQDIIIGKIKECLKEQRYESVAADDSLKKTGTDKLGK